mmetsp:Transcript_1030/g.1664  ORF Transcript_1030/g.1664 Transcript_1030/m.1664 type:complete len:414 (+) Transcript_1030:34-1275(+)
MARGKDFKDAVLAYQYSSPPLSILERAFLDKFWSNVVHLYPMWLAPNVITLMGYACVWVAVYLILSNSPALEGTCDSWVYLVSSVLVFFYQTLDGSDGKQARRTKSGSALGELMDHGVDAVVTTLLPFMTADTFGYGISSLWPWTFALAAQVAFCLSNMTLVHSGCQKFFELDCMEIQWSLILILAFGGLFGPEFFTSTTFPIPPQMSWIKTDFFGLLRPDEIVDLTSGRIELKIVLIIAGLGGCITNMFVYLFYCLAPYIFPTEKQKEHLRKTGYTISILFVHVLRSWGQLFLSYSAILLSRNNIAGDDRKHGALRALLFVSSFSFADLMDRILMLRVAREPLAWIPTGFYPLMAFSVLAKFDSQIGELPVEWFNVLVVVQVIIHHSYFISSVLDLARVLRVHPLKVGKLKD